ncbi:MAG: class I SAM-dependent methyltransferase [Bacteroidia bacterium]|nr:class I SAM-dependent methyltransferase [Bacteroidia bacterium]
MKELWDARYAGGEYVYGTSPNRFFAAELDKLKPGCLLLPGEGEGRNAVWAASKGWTVDAIDFSKEAQRKAMMLAKQMQVELNSFTVADLLEADLPPQHYDAASEVFVHLPPALRKQWHARLAQALKPGARLIIEAYHLNQLTFGTGGPQNPELLYTAQLLQADFPGFEILLLEEVEEMLSEGLLHNGPSALVRLVAQKR